MENGGEKCVTYKVMVILCILIFPFAVLAELMKMNDDTVGGKDETDHILASEKEADQRKTLRAVLSDMPVLQGV